MLCLPVLLAGMAMLLLLAGCASGIEADVSVRPDGSWTGQVRLAFGAPPAAPPAWQAVLDRRVAQGAAELLDGRGIDHRLLATEIENEQVIYTWQVSGKGPSTPGSLLAVDAVDGEGLAGALTLVVTGRLRAGQELELALPANPSTGYGWTLASGSDSAVVQLGDIESRQLTPGTGALARQVIRLRAVAGGPARLELDYRRPWQPDEQPIRRLVVRAPGLDLGRVLAGLSMPAREPVDVHPAVGEPAGAEVQAEPQLSRFNWCGMGGCTPVKDQGGCGGCWAFGTVGVLESAIKLGDGVTSDLSEQYLVSCNSEGWSCRGGWWAHDYHDWKFSPPEARAGAVPESAFPYQASDVPCGGPYPHPYQIASWAYVYPASPFSIPSVAAIKQAIADHGPIAVAMCTGSAFGGYRGGVFAVDESSQCGGGVNHAVVLVGWNDDEQSWTLRNSWGPAWGEGGYMRIRWNTSNVGYGASYVTYHGHPPAYDHAVYVPLSLKRAR
jgi:predicted secreted protein